MTKEEQSILLCALTLYIEDSMNEQVIKTAKRLYQRILEEDLEDE